MTPIPTPSPPVIRTDALLPSAERISASVVWGAGLVGLVIAASNLAMWWVPSLRFFAAWPGVMIMRANTGLAISTAALSLLAWQLAGRTRPWPVWHWIAQLLGLVSVIIGAVTTFDYLLKIDSGFDTLFAAATFPEDQAHAFVVVPGRMSLNAAISLLFLGLALCGLDWSVRWGRKKPTFTAPVFAVLAALPACFGMVGYLSGTGGFTGLLKSTHVLFHTAASLVILAIGVMAVRIQRHPVRRLFSKSAGGILLRWLLPGATASLILLAWLIGKGRTHGLVAQGEGTALMLFGGLILLYTLIVSASRAINVQEAKTHLATSALQQEERRSQSILETSLDGVLLMDNHGRVVDWNLAAERIFGWSREEMRGRLLAEHIIPERLREDHARGLERYLRTGQAQVLGKRMELPALRRDGTEFPVELGINAVADAVPPLFVGFIRDITHRRKAEEALREAKEQAEKASLAKDDFLAALSHELRTPLTPVLLTSSVLSQDPRLPEDVRSSVEMIERHVTLEARLIDDLLDLTRITRGKLHLRMEVCDLKALIHHAVEIVRADAPSETPNIHLELHADDHLVFGDPARIQQVFWNLLKNAFKFTPVPGDISVRTWRREEEREVIIEVQDTGVGFAPSRADQLFLPFEQEKTGTQHRFGGLGLGLAIARSIVTLHGGSIQAASPGLGLGAVFTVTLPCGVPDEINSPAQATPTLQGLSKAPGLHILLVEDHDHTRQVLARLLQRAGHRVTAASHVKDALEVASALASGHSPDVLISDLGLPDGSGLDLMQQLRNQGHLLPGIALSGYGMEEDLQRTREAGFACHLVKPVKFDQLVQALAEIRSQEG